MSSTNHSYLQESPPSCGQRTRHDPKIQGRTPQSTRKHVIIHVLTHKTETLTNSSKDAPSKCLGPSTNGQRQPRHYLGQGPHARIPLALHCFQRCFGPSGYKPPRGYCQGNTFDVPPRPIFDHLGEDPRHLPDSIGGGKSSLVLLQDGRHSRRKSRQVSAMRVWREMMASKTVCTASLGGQLRQAQEMSTMPQCTCKEAPTVG